MLRFKASQDQFKKLQGLAYWIANSNYIRERYGNDDPELINCAETLKDIFNDLDKNHVPFWVQNTVISWAGNWRQYHDHHINDALAERGITT